MAKTYLKGNNINIESGEEEVRGYAVTLNNEITTFHRKISKVDWEDAKVHGRVKLGRIHYAQTVNYLNAYNEGKSGPVILSNVHQIWVLVEPTSLVEEEGTLYAEFDTYVGVG